MFHQIKVRIHNLVFISAALLCSIWVFAQAPVPPAGYSGQALRTWFKQHYYDGIHVQHSYQDARIRMYNYIDNHNNKVTCVYSGYQVNVTYGGSGSNPQPINCEHTVPQSFFNYNMPMKSDIHHLFPSYGNWNSTRSNHPFAEIADNQTTKWMYLNQSQATIPSGNINLYSEYVYPKFEPREDHKGDVARAVFYFYTMYPTQAGNISAVGNLQTLYQWHLGDPVSSAEYQRNIDIAAYQGSRNPYVDYPGYAGIAWGVDSVIRTSVDSCAMSDLIISEYAEGSSINCAIELANFTGNAVDLSDYSIKQQTNGTGGWTTGVSLSGQLANNSVYVIVSSYSTDTSLLNKADLTTSGTAMYFTGNDVIGLFRSGSLIDVVGTQNVNSNFGQDVTLVRIDSIKQPTATYTSAEWMSFTQNTFDSLGSHHYDCSLEIIQDTATEDTTITDPDTAITCVPDTQLVWPAADLFFSEYNNGTYYGNTALEIANYTGQTVNLADYRIKQQTNGAGGWTTGFLLSGQLADGEVYVVIFSYANNGTLLAADDLSTSNTAMYFTGNDVLGLFKNSTLIDIIGTLNVDTTYAADTTLVRYCHVNVPSTSFCMAEWFGLAPDDFSNVGSHEHGPPCSTEKRGTEDEQETETPGELQIFPNPASDRFTVQFAGLFASAPVQVSVFDIHGRSVGTYPATAEDMVVNRLTINTTAWSPGMYLVKVVNSRGSATRTIVIE